MQLTRPLVLAAALALAAAPPSAIAAPRAEVAVATISAHAPSPDRATAYAEREARDRSVAEFEGGSVVIVGVSAGALVVLLIALLQL